MKKKVFLMSLLFGCLCLSRPASAQIPIVGLVTSAIKKVIVAIDLKVQQLQNETIALQNAEKAIENKMALGNLNDISGWLDKEKKLYAGYYNELQQVKSVIADYELVKNVVKQQEELVKEYHQAYSLFQQDKNFSPTEISYMGQVYNGILQQSIQNLNEVVLAISNMSTQMSDGERLGLIHKASGKLQQNLNDLRLFNNNGVQLSLQRAKDRDNMATVKKIYGLN